LRLHRDKEKRLSTGVLIRRSADQLFRSADRLFRNKDLLSRYGAHRLQAARRLMGNAKEGIRSRRSVGVLACESGRRLAARRFTHRDGA